MRVGAPSISPEDPGDASVFYKTAITVVLAFLYAAQIPALGRDTLFADMEAAYSRLSPPLRHFLSAGPVTTQTFFAAWLTAGWGRCRQ